MIKQVRNQEFFGQGKDTLINNYVENEKERPRREKSPFFLLETLKNGVLSEKFNS